MIWNFNKFEEVFLLTDNVKVLSVYTYFKACTGAMEQGTGASLALIIAVLGAYSFSRVRYRGRALVQRGILFVYMFGGILILIPLYQLAVRAGLASTQAGTFITMIVVYMVQTLPVSRICWATTSERTPPPSRRRP